MQKIQLESYIRTMLWTRSPAHCCCLARSEWHRGQDCLNGIAVLDEDSGELLLTGKLWRRAYRVKVDSLVKESVEASATS